MGGGRLARDLVAALITASASITYAISFGALLFAGRLTSHVSQGITIMLVTTAVSGLAIALTSSFRYAIGGPESNSTAIFAAIGATIAESLPGDAPSAARHLALDLMLGGAATGVALIALGALRMGRWIRYIPYPIVAGFLAATGWLIFNGALRVIAGISIPNHVSATPTPATGAQLAVGVAFAGVLFALRRVRNPALVPALLLAATALTDVGLSLTIGLDGARAAGWLIPTIGRPELTSLLDPGAYAGVSWALVASTTPAMATALVVAAIAILFSAAGLEVYSGDDVDLDRELRSSGIGSFLSGLLGGAIGVLLPVRSIINAQAGAVSRASGVAVAIVSLAALAGGGPALAFVARPILGGFLLSLGFGLLLDWLLASFRRLSRTDALLVVAIVVVTGAAGFLPALIVGLLFSCVTFVIRYGRFRVVRYVLSARNKRSRVERGPSERMLLESGGDRIRVLVLQGYVFFGTANVVFEEARTLLMQPSEAALQSLILDFGQVSGLDTSAAHSLAKLAALARRNGTLLVWSGLGPAERALLARAGDVLVDGPLQRLCPDLDHALELAEERLLATMSRGERERPEDWLARELRLPGGGAALLHYFEQVAVRADDYLFRQGDPADSLYLVTEGRLVVAIGNGEGRTRLRSMNAGSFIGEMGLYSGEPRSANVVAETDAELLRLTTDGLHRLGEDEPAVAAAFHGLVFRLQAERLRFANAEIAALQT